GALASGDDYATSAKPQIDWDDTGAREELIDSRARDAYACLLVLESRVLSAEVKEAAELLATVIGQDLEETEDGTYRIARRVAKDRVISTVDTEARHGHKTSARGFDGYSGHVSLDPDSEFITDTAATAANAGDASVAAELIEDLVDNEVASSGAADASAGSEPEPSCADEQESERPKV
ncbi:MAG: IS1182 family transposase, partial [bacterium]|nr:IS1182 family transposase [bacterium]